MYLEDVKIPNSFEQLASTGTAGLNAIIGQLVAEKIAQLLKRSDLPMTEGGHPAVTRPSVETVSGLMTTPAAPRPVWIRIPSRGREFYTGMSRSALIQLAVPGKSNSNHAVVRSVLVKKSRRNRRGTRHVFLADLLAHLEACSANSA